MDNEIVRKCCFVCWWYAPRRGYLPVGYLPQETSRLEELHSTCASVAWRGRKIKSRSHSDSGGRAHKNVPSYAMPCQKNVNKWLSVKLHWIINKKLHILY